ncbi:MAG TPA: hypothetical protein VHM19_19810 [Polyangiales bacterium]|nr:hypothetical protein [Polyangiales bacterium]
MDFREALGLLGVEPGQDAATVRRAYLRKLKQHPPERDPEGFKRLRDAYEQLQHGTSFMRVLPETPSPPPTAASSAVPLPEPARAEPVHDEPTPGPPAADESAADDSNNDELPDDEDFGSDAYDPPARELEVDTLPDPDFAAWCEKTATPHGWPQVAQALLRRERYEEAAQLARSRYQLAAKDPFAPRAAAYWAVPLIAALIEHGQPKLARDVHNAFVTAHEASDRGEPLRYALLRELVGVSFALPDEVNRCIARSLVDRPELAEQGLRDFSDDRPQSAKDARETLLQLAPMLANLYGDLLRPPDRRRRFSLGGGWPRWGWITFIVLRGLFALGHPCREDKPSSFSTADLDLRPPIRAFCDSTDHRPWCPAVVRWRASHDCTVRRAASGEVFLEYQHYLVDHKVPPEDASAIEAILGTTDAQCSKLQEPKP